MKAITEDSKNIVLYERNHIAIRLVYTGRFSKKASVIDSNNQVFSIVPIGFWKTKLEVRHNQKCLFKIKKKWTGTAEISTDEDSLSTILTFKHKGFFNSRYVIQDKDERELAVVMSKFRWKGFRYDFEIEVSDSLKRRENHFVILGVMLYLVRELKRQHAGGGAATGAAVAAIT